MLNINEPQHPPLPQTLPLLQRHAMCYLRRVYPDGRRVTSSNLDPWMQWRSGAQMACLNWQNWDEAMWLNEAMFGGTGGWVVNPNPELEGGDGRRKCQFMGRVIGLSARESLYRRVCVLNQSLSHPVISLSCGFFMQCPDARGTNTTL